MIMFFFGATFESNITNCNCIVFLQSFQTLYKIEDESTFSPCNSSANSTMPDFNNSTILFMRVENATSCNVLKYINYTVDHKAGGLLVISNKYKFNSSHLPKSLNIVGFLDDTVGEKVKESLKKNPFGELVVLAVDDGFEWSTVLLWGMAVFCVAVGGWLGPSNDPNYPMEQEQILEGNVSYGQPKPVKVDFTVKMVKCICICIVFKASQL